MPVRKHGKGSVSPPTSPRPIRSAAPAPTPSRQHSSSSSSSNAAAGPSPLLPSTMHNVPNLPSQVNIYHPSSPPSVEFRTPAVPRKVISHQQQQQQQQPPPSPVLFSAPKVRAKITPAATPRRKGYLPGTEFADVPLRRAGEAGSPVKRVGAPPPPALVVARPVASSSPSATGYGSFPSYHDTIPEQYEPPMPTMRGVAAPSGSSSRAERSTKGRDNVLVCVR